MKRTIFILTLLLPICFLFAQFNNNSEVISVGDENAESFISQTGTGLNDSYLYQRGDGNSGKVTQTNEFLRQGDENWSNVFQKGMDNSATVEQITYHWIFAGAGMIIADVDQVGDGNVAEVKQKGLGLNATIRQNGNNGVAKQYQGMSVYRRGEKAYLSDAYIIQRTQVDQGSVAEQHQVGLQNDAEIDQNSWRSRAEQIQINDKMVLKGHRGIRVNQAMIKQTNGGSNVAHQLQYYPSDAVPNVANTLQNGNRNYSEEVQFGGGNNSDVLQRGDGNRVNVMQTSNARLDPGLSIPTMYQY